MNYKSFIIERYRAISKPVKINLEKDKLVPIIGINEFGKTTVLNAIFAYDTINDYQNSIFGHLNDVNNLYETKDEPAIVKAQISMTYEELQWVKENYTEKLKTKYKEASKPEPKELRLPPKSGFSGEIVVGRKISKSGNEYFLENAKMFGNLEDEHLLSEQIVLLCPYIIYFDDFRDSLPDKIEITNNDVNDINSLWIAILDQLFKKTNSDYSVYSLPSLERRFQKNILSDVENKLKETLTKEWENFRLDNKEALKISLSFFQEEDKDSKITKNYISIEVVEKIADGKERNFYVRDRSKGFYWFFNFVMKLEFNPKNLDDKGGNVFLLDEPGSFLHPFAQNKLCKKLSDLSSDNIVIYCTHTHYLLDPEVIPLNKIKIANKNESGSVNLVNYYDYKGHETSSSFDTAYRPIYDALGLKPFNLELSHKKLVLVEGICDYYFYSIFNTDSNISFIPMHGATTFNNLVSLLIGLRSKFAVIWDNDFEGIESFKKSKEFFGDEIARKFYLLPKSDSESKKILQDLIEGRDIKLIKDELKVMNEISFKKLASMFYYSSEMKTILEKISDKTKNNFSKVINEINFD